MIRNMRWLTIVISLILGLLVAACDDGEETVDSTPTKAQGGSPTAPLNGEETTVPISLAEWTITSEQGAGLSVAPGKVTFDVSNDGEVPHELAVIATDTDPGDLPEDGAVVDEEAAGELIDRTSQIAGDDSATLTVELPAGAYALICNVEGHYAQGMFAELAVE
ncbi:MAG: sulfocyanin-like copper-binding protein [Dehalococcoidia bacterium]